MKKNLTNNWPQAIVDSIKATECMMVGARLPEQQIKMIQVWANYHFVTNQLITISSKHIYMWFSERKTKHISPFIKKNQSN